MVWVFSKIPKRSSLISLLFLFAIALVIYQVYSLWREPGWNPKVAQRRGPALTRQSGQVRQPKRPPGTDLITTRNLFDPQRRGQGTGGGVATDVKALEGMVLVGTIVSEGERFAIVKFPKRLLAKGGRQGAGMRRLTVGDTVLGYRVSEIQPDRVVFESGSSSVELVIDFSRRPDGSENRKIQPAARGKPGGPGNSQRRPPVGGKP